jgi:uncharacterized protein YbaP (TraB family)
MLSIFTQCHSSKVVSVYQSTLPANDNTFNSLLWEISGNQLKEPSYLFGTIHLIPEKEFFLSDIAKQKLAQSKRLCLEIDLDDPATITASLKGVMRKGVLLKDLLNGEDYTFLIKKLDQNDIPISMVKSLKPLLVSTLLLEKSADEKMLNYESELAALAKQQQKEIIGLESAEFQMSMLDSIPYEEQAKMLVDEARKAAGFSELRQMIRLYKTQNIDAIYNYIINQSVGFNAKFERILLSNRNENWIPVIAEKASEMSTFFAVGAGHLGGEAGVIRQLRAKGFTVRAVL